LLLLDMPPHAAVGTAVALARTVGLAPFSGLVNAVLRKVATGGVAVLETLDSPRLDTPAWLWASWGADARAIAEAHQHEAPLDLTLAPGIEVPEGQCRCDRFGALSGRNSRRGDSGFRRRAGCGCRTPPRRCPPCCWRRGPANGSPILCAAPGGKTAQLAAAGAQVTAVERDPARLARLAENLTRWRLNVELVLADVLAWTPPALFDAVLLDAPCSATGTIRRHPDVAAPETSTRYQLLSEAQDKLIAAAARLLRPGDD